MSVLIGISLHLCRSPHSSPDRLFRCAFVLLRKSVAAIVPFEEFYDVVTFHEPVKVSYPSPLAAISTEGRLAGRLNSFQEVSLAVLLNRVTKRVGSGPGESAQLWKGLRDGQASKGSSRSFMRETA